MYLRCHSRTKNGKRHRHFTISESRRIAGGKVVQRRVLHLGEINDSQKEAWQKSICVFDESKNLSCELSLFSEDQMISPPQANAISLRVSELSLHRPRAFGDCWLGWRLWEELGLSRFWREKLGEVRGEVAWGKVLQLLAVIPTEATLQQMRDEKIAYLVGTPKATLGRLEGELLGQSWEQVHAGMKVKLLEKQDELYVQAQSADRRKKENAMRRRKFKAYVQGINKLRGKPTPKAGIKTTCRKEERKIVTVHAVLKQIAVVR